MGVMMGKALGDLNNITRASQITEDDYIDACKGNRGMAAKKLCSLSKKNKQPVFRTRGLSTVDLNNDGFIDLVVAHHVGRLLFFHNRPTGAARNNLFIAFKLKGGGPGIGKTYGVGATLILYSRNMGGNNGQMTTQFREVSSYQLADKFGYQDDRIIFGLSRNGKPVKLDVRWPSGDVRSYDLSNWVFSSRLKPIEIPQ